MDLTFSSVSLVARDTDPDVEETVELLTALLLGRGLKVWVSAETDFADLPGVQECDEANLAEHCDLMIAIGGDGTMLRAARLINRANLPLLGVNRGRRGFLADLSPDELEQKMSDILDGEYLRESRMMLQATLYGGDHLKQQVNALNDVVIQRGATGQMLDFEVKVDGAYVNTHRGDGLIIATPTGSTAYSLSSGGPIMQPGLNAVAMVPICPHTLSDRPVIIPGNSCINIAIRHRYEADAFITVDGKMTGDVSNTDSLQVTQSIHRITLLHPASYDYFEVLRSKLNWGHYGLPEKA